MPVSRGSYVAGRALAAGRAAGLVSITGAMLAGVRAHQRLAARDPNEARAVFDRWMRPWARSLLRLFGIEVRIDGAAPAAERARLVVASHRSPVDIPILLSLFGGIALSRGDLARWPVLGAAARDAGTIFVDRESESSGASAIRSIRRRLRDGATVIVFPEGTTHAGDEVRTFHAGAFAAARGLDVEVLPVGLAYEPGVELVNETFGQHLARVAARPRTRVGVAIGAPRDIAGQTAPLVSAIHGDVQALVARARALIA